MLTVKLIVPAVVVPAFLYLSSIIRSQDLANLLEGFAVIAVTILAPCFLAILAATMLACVLPEMEMTNTFPPLINKGLWIMSVG